MINHEIHEEHEMVLEIAIVAIVMEIWGKD